MTRSRIVDEPSSSRLHCLGLGIHWHSLNVPMLSTCHPFQITYTKLDVKKTQGQMLDVVRIRVVLVLVARLDRGEIWRYGPSLCAWQHQDRWDALFVLSLAIHIIVPQYAFCSCGQNKRASRIQYTRTGFLWPQICSRATPKQRR